MGLFSAFSPLAGGTMDTYLYPNEYPYDLDAGLDFTRPATGAAYFPFPVTIGHIDGLVPQFNRTEFGIMFGKTPFGPAVSQYLDPVAVFPNVMGSLAKVKG